MLARKVSLFSSCCGRDELRESRQDLTILGEIHRTAVCELLGSEQEVSKRAGGWVVGEMPKSLRASP